MDGRGRAVYAAAGSMRPIPILLFSILAVAGYRYGPPVPSTAQAPPPLALPRLVGFGPDAGVGVAIDSFTVRAGPGGADSLFGHFSNAAYTSNDFPGKETFDADRVGPADAEDLSLQNRRDDAACVRFRVGSDPFGPWICDWNDAREVAIRWRERHTLSQAIGMPHARAVLGGFGGWSANVRAAIALPRTASAGEDIEVQLRWNGTEGTRSGYRLFDVDLISRHAGAGQLANAVALRDPETFQPYSAHPDSLAAGRAAWMARGTLMDYGPGGILRPIRSSCQDCHPTEGRDLRFFNYEPEVVASRAVFHALPAATARNIASYVASIDLGVPAGYDHDADGQLAAAERGRSTYFGCRPWNPPFQPGPGLDRLPVGEWICGAGADAVLEADHLMAPFLFPTGFHPDSIRALYGGGPDRPAARAINRREMPIPIQLPIWTDWLGRVGAPDMAADWDAYCRTGTNNLCWESGDFGFGDAVGFGRPARETAPGRVERNVESQRRYHQGASGGVTHEPYLVTAGVPFPALRAPYDTGFREQLARLGLYRAMGVRLWDILTFRSNAPWINEYGVAETGWEIANDMACEVPNERAYRFEWPGTEYVLVGPTAPGSSAGDYASTEVSSSLNTAFRNRVTCAEARGSSGVQSHLGFFSMSSHFVTRTGYPNWGYPDNHAPYVGFSRNVFDAAVWYELLTVIDTPSRNGDGRAFDWPYVTAHTQSLGEMRGTSSALLTIANGLKLRATYEGTPEVGGLRPAVVYNYVRELTRPDQWAYTVDALGAESARMIQAGLAGAWLDWYESFGYAEVESARGSNMGELEAASTTFRSPGHGSWPAWEDRPGQFLLDWAWALHAMDAPGDVAGRMARYGASLFDEPSGFGLLFCDPASGAIGACASETRDVLRDNARGPR